MRGRMKQSFRFRKDLGLPITKSAFSDNGSVPWSFLPGNQNPNFSPADHTPARAPESLRLP